MLTSAAYTYIFSFNFTSKLYKIIGPEWDISAMIVSLALPNVAIICMTVIFITGII